MRSGLHAKLMTSFITVIAVTGIIGGVVGVHLIGTGIMREAQNKVTLDLNSAHQIYRTALREIEHTLRFTAMRRVTVREALRNDNVQLLTEALIQSMHEGGLDFLTLTDPQGNVIFRAHNPEIKGDNQAGDMIVRRVLETQVAAGGTVIMFGEELHREGADLAGRACIAIIPTPMARPDTRRESVDGMVLKAAVPIQGTTASDLLGVLYGGVLLNRNYGMVDTIKDLVYRGVRYENKEVGTATIFQHDLRISTNVMTADGSRAVGTRVSSAVYDRVLGEGRRWTERAFVVNDWYLTAYEPIADPSGAVIGILYVGMLEKKYKDMQIETLLVFLGVTTAGTVLAIVISGFLAGTIVKPVRRLEQGVEGIARGDFDIDVSIASRDEIGSLAASFNRVREELKQTYARLQDKVEAADENLKQAYMELQAKQEQLVNAERLASMGQLSAGIAHEINNPLGTILLHSHILMKEFKEHAQAVADLKLIVEESTRCKNIVRGLLDFARQSRVNKVPTDMGRLVDDVMLVMLPRAAAAGADLEKKVPDGIGPVMLDRDQVKQVLINLVANSIEAMGGPAGRIIVEVRVEAGCGQLEILVTDNGCGIPAESIGKLFTPFFTTKEMGKGTGLGLAIVYGIVKMHRGDITVASTVGQGTTFTMHFPMGAEEAAVRDLQA